MNNNMIVIKQKGNFKKVTSYFEKLKNAVKLGILDKYGALGVEKLSAATPVNTGLTSQSWGYRIQHSTGSVSIIFYNTNIQNGMPIAIILQYGHGTKNGGWVEGSDYINPAIRPVFNSIASAAWKEVTEL